MGILDKVLDTWARPTAPEGVKASEISAILSRVMGGRAAWTSTQHRALVEEGYMKNSIAFRCVNERATAIASVNWRVMRDTADGAVWERNHPLQKLFVRCNPWTAWPNAIYAESSYLDIWGEAYLQATVNAAGEPVELHVLRPDNMKVYPGPAGVDRYEFEVGGRKVPFKVDPITGRCLVLQLKTFNPIDQFHGVPPLAIAVKDFNLHNAFAEWNKHVLENDFRPGLVIEADFNPTPDQEKQLTKEAKEEKLGFNNAAEPLVLRKGLHVKEVGWSPKDIDWVEGRRQAARDICHPFGMSPLMINLPGDSTYSNYKEARVAFWEGPVRWLYTLFEAELTWWFRLLYRDETIRIEANLDDTPAVMEREEMLYGRQEKVKDIATVDERRAVLGWSPLPDEVGGIRSILTGAANVPLEDVVAAEESSGSAEGEGEKGAADLSDKAEYIELMRAGDLGLTDGEIKAIADEVFGDAPVDGKPFANEHACRLKDPGKYVAFARQNGKEHAGGKPVDYIFGVRKDGKTELQAMRYPKGKWTAEDAAKHCRARSGILFEPAAGSAGP